MKHKFISVTFIGDDLNLPSTFIMHPNVMLKQSIKKGEFSEKGRFRTTPVDYGYLEFQINNEKQENLLRCALDFIQSNIDLLFKNGLEEIWLNLSLEKEKQNNIEFDNTDLKEIVALHIKFSITIF